MATPATGAGAAGAGLLGATTVGTSLVPFAGAIGGHDLRRRRRTIRRAGPHLYALCFSLYMLQSPLHRLKLLFRKKRTVAKFGNYKRNRVSTILETMMPSL